MKIWTDGGCIGNGDIDAIGAWAFVSEDGHEDSGRLEQTTNNRAELRAIIEAIKFASHRTRDIEILTDSLLCVNCGMRRWKRKANVDMWKLFDGACAGLNVKLTWVKGHSGIPQNERCDELCGIQMAQADAPDHVAHMKAICKG